ncbi:MAG: hypothetical protein ACLT4C_06585 [Butyricicoccus sp.]
MLTSRNGSSARTISSVRYGWRSMFPAAQGFTVDEYQSGEGVGADAVLLLMGCWIRIRCGDIMICDLGHITGETTTSGVRSAVAAGARVIGVNSRNLKDFSVDLNNAARLRAGVPAGAVFIAEAAYPVRRTRLRCGRLGRTRCWWKRYLMRSLDKGGRCAARGSGEMKLILRLTRMQDILAANAARDYVGFVFADSRRRVTENRRAAARAAAPGIQAVGVFVNDEPERIAALVNAGAIDLVPRKPRRGKQGVSDRLRGMTGAPVLYAVRVGAYADIERVRLSSGIPAVGCFDKRHLRWERTHI